MSEAGRGAWLRLACPACRGAVVEASAAYRCGRCARTYPVLFGIPDFRLRSDRYLSLEDEREKARRLHEFGATATFESLLRHYYEITDDVPPGRAQVFAGTVLDGPRRGQAIVKDLGLDAGIAVLDAGCGSGGGLVALARDGRRAAGLDIALRWLVIAKKRLEEAGLSAPLLCADIEAPPLEPQQFGAVVAADLLEHVRDFDAGLDGLASLVEPRGRLWISATNRLWIGPDPATGLWAASLLSPRLRRLWGGVGGLDPLRHVRRFSAAALARACSRRGLRVIRQAPKPPPAPRGRVFAVVSAAYALLCTLPAARDLLVRLGPAFQLVAQTDGKLSGGVR